MKLLITLVLILYSIELFTQNASAQAIPGVRQTSIIAEAQVSFGYNQCRTIRYYSLKRISSIPDSLIQLDKMGIIASAIIIKKQKDFYIIQDARTFSDIDVKQQVEKVKLNIGDAYIVPC